MAIYQIEDRQPRIDPSAWVAPSAEIIGETTIGAHASIWFGAVVRADNCRIAVGARTSIQENAVLHTDPDLPLTIGDDCTIGHSAVLHGCTIGDGSLIGIQSVVMNGAVIGKQCLVGAGAIVTERKTFPDRTLIIGVPAKAMRELTDAEVANLASAAAGYVSRGGLFRDELERVG